MYTFTKVFGIYGKVDGDEKMKEIIIASSVILSVAAVSTVGCFVQHILKHNLLDGDGMVNDRCLSCKYHYGGGMERDSVSITVKENDNETATLEVVSCSSPDYEEITENYTVSFDSLEKIYQLYTKYDVKNWGKLPESELIALDAPVTSISIKTVNTTVSFDSNKEFPGDGYSIILDIRSVLYDCIEQARSSEQPGSAE